MHRSITLAFVAAALLSAAPIAIDRAAAPGVGLATAEAAASVDINVFFTSLASYGSWVPSPNYNYVWVPSQVDADWAPYTNGHWIYTDQYGWYFASDEPFASIVYHYGRWGFDPLLGWYWVPGTNWAPAWVAWRQDADDIGWAPLPPQGEGYATNINITINIGDVPDHYWRFVPNNQFLAPQLRTVAFAGDRRPDVFSASRPSGFVTVQNNIIVNNVITLNFVEQQTKQKITPTRVDVVTDPRQAGPGPGGNGNANGGNNSDNSVKAFIASLNPPSKTAAPAKIDNPTAIQVPTKGQSGQPANPQGKPGPTFSALTPNGGNVTGGSVTGPNGGGPNGGAPGGNGPAGNGANGSSGTGGAAVGSTGPANANPAGGNPPGGPAGPNGNGNNGTGKTASTGPVNADTACPQDTDPKTPGCQLPKGPEGTGNPGAGPQLGALPANPGPTGGDTGKAGNGNGPQNPGSATATPKIIAPTGGNNATGNNPAGNGVKTDNGSTATGNGSGKGGPGGGQGNPAGNNGQPTGGNNLAQGNGPGNGPNGPGNGGSAAGPAGPAGATDNGKCVDTDPKTPGCQPAPVPGVAAPGKP